MAHKNRYINTHFWDDLYIVELDPIEKLLFLYLLTSPLNNIAGCYEIQLRRIAFDTGIDKDMVAKILQRFERDEKVYYIEGHILILNFAKHQKLNHNIVTGIEKVLNELPETIKETKAFESLYKAFESLLKASNYLNLNLNSNLNINSNTNSNRNASPKPKSQHASVLVSDVSLTNELKEPNKNERPFNDTDPLFERVWELYQRRGSKAEAYKQWKTLSPDERTTVAEHIPRYIDSITEPRYQKHFERYLKQRHFESEPPPKHNIFSGSI